MGTNVFYRHSTAKILSFQAKFLWTGQIEYKGWTPVACRTVTSPRFEGGLGLRDVETQNKAAFAHLVWRFLTLPDTLWSRILRHKYLRSRDFRDVEARPQDTILWRGILRQKATILDNQRWVVGNGTQIRALDDIWVAPYGPLREHLVHENGLLSLLQTVGRNSDKDILVANFIIVEASASTWDCARLESLWPPAIVNRIQELGLGGEDLRCWKNEPAGSCRFKALYQHLQLRQIGHSFPWQSLGSDTASKNKNVHLETTYESFTNSTVTE